ncbi:MAG: flippase-like domain-containing protein [Deltaproteobacteria bacterium]|nr:flippase-like domain-containing protein [Deltaproteobacteria bacterium]MBI2500983.1 flippase-like domain-containing protein [Deltaproteobacteria bacterium]
MKFLRFFFLLFAIGLATSIIYVLGPSKILQNIRLVGWNLGWVFLIGFPRYILYTIAWRMFLPPNSYSLGKLFQIKVAGELITRSTPVHFLGGDTARILLMGKRLSRTDQAGSVIIDRTVMTFGGGIIVLLGLMLASFRLPLSLLPQLTLWLLVGLLFAGLFFIISHQKKTAFESLLNLLGRIGFKRWIKPTWVEKTKEIDTSIRRYYEKGHSDFLKAVGIIVVARLTVALEIFLLLKFLNIPLGFLEAIIFSSMSLLMTVLFFLFPGNLGILEGTYGVLFHWLGFDPATGVSLELLRKLNSGLWYFVGAAIALTFKREAVVRKRDEGKNLQQAS